MASNNAREGAGAPQIYAALRAASLFGDVRSLIALAEDSGRPWEGTIILHARSTLFG